MTFKDIAPNPIPTPVQALLALFEAELSAVKFPDVDAAVLKNAAAQVVKLAEAVSQAEAALETARQAYHDGQESLLQRAQRALAYARVFAEGSPDLGAKLENIVLGRPQRKASRSESGAMDTSAKGDDDSLSAKKRGRPSKTRGSDAEHPSETAQGSNLIS